MTAEEYYDAAYAAAEQEIRLADERKAALSELADRVERLDEPSRHIDAEVACAIHFPHLRPATLNDFDGKYGFTPGNLKVDTGFLMSYSYTRSVDDALTAKPKGWRFAGLFERNCKLPNWIWKAEFWHPEADRNVRGIARKADRPAIAILAACLRAEAEGLSL